MPLVAFALPGRLPPRGGISFLRRRIIGLRMRDGLQARCTVDEAWSFIEVFALRHYDATGIDWLALQTIVDVGANVGASTLWLTRRAPESRIVAVEPNPDAFRRLEHNVALNRLEERVELVPAAIGGDTGVRYLTLEAHSSLLAKVTTKSGNGSPIVTQLSLADLLQHTSVTSLDLLKLDCEGSEYDILLAADHETLRRVAAIVGEYHPVPDHAPGDIARHLLDEGFRCRVRGGPMLGHFVATRASSLIR
jgi:FkbM family methyltransferase